MITHELCELWLSLDVVNQVYTVAAPWAVYQQGHLKYTRKNLSLKGRSLYNILNTRYNENTHQVKR
jgi:hypothetical protein